MNQNYKLIQIEVDGRSYTFVLVAEGCLEIIGRINPKNKPQVLLALNCMGYKLINW